MNDATISRMCLETTKHLRNAISVNTCPYLVPSYNALVSAAKHNHPEDTFLNALVLIPTEGENHEHITIAEISALFAQIGIALESLQPDTA